MSEEAGEKKRDIVPDVCTFLLFMLAVAGWVAFLGSSGGRYGSMYAQLEIDLPPNTRFFLALSAAFRSWWFAVIPGVGLLGLLFLFLARGRAWIGYVVGLVLIGALVLFGYISLDLPAKRIQQILQRLAPAPTPPASPGGPASGPESDSAVEG